MSSLLIFLDYNKQEQVLFCKLATKIFKTHPKLTIETNIEKIISQEKHKLLNTGYSKLLQKEKTIRFCELQTQKSEAEIGEIEPAVKEARTEFHGTEFR
jgi:hypothetical protein